MNAAAPKVLHECVARCVNKEADVSDPQEIILEGGPIDIPSQWTSPAVESLRERVKIERLNGYDHFERTEDFRKVGDVDLPVFRWAYRTQIAE
jgi:hypothetical protein